MKGEKGFLVLEILIAGLILTSSIAATMYLFRIGFDHLERANISNVFSSKLPQAVNLIKTLDIGNNTGVEDMGEGVILRWEANLIEKNQPVISTTGGSIYELFIYRVDFKLDYKNTSREYRINVFKYKTMGSPSETMF